MLVFSFTGIWVPLLWGDRDLAREAARRFIAFGDGAGSITLAICLTLVMWIGECYRRLPEVRGLTIAGILVAVLGAMTMLAAGLQAPSILAYGAAAVPGAALVVIVPLLVILWRVAGSPLAACEHSLSLKRSATGREWRRRRQTDDVGKENDSVDTHRAGNRER